MLTDSTLEQFLAGVPKNSSLLDIGCGNGAALLQARRLRADLRLAGVDIGVDDLAEARERLPDVELRQAPGHKLPFSDGRFDIIICLEVIEHIPEALRPAVFNEARRVIKPHGRMMVTTPHKGAFAWLDAQNMRHRFPTLYRLVKGRSDRDRNYGDQQEVVWHHHFTRSEVESLLDRQWSLVDVTYPGFVITPLVDLLSFPFHRTRRYNNPVFRAMIAAFSWEDEKDFGPSAGYGIRVVARAD
jgi:SAM-dependent methyltransferase